MAAGPGGARRRPPRLTAAPQPRPLCARGPTALSSAAPARCAPRPVRGPGQCGAVGASVGLGVYRALAVGLSLSLPLLSAGPFFLPQDPAGGLKFAAVSHSSSRCGRKRLVLKGRRQACGAGKRRAAWSGAAFLPAARVPRPLTGTGGRGQWRALGEAAVPLSRPVGGPCLTGTVVCPGAAFASIPLSPGVGSEARKEPEVIPGSTSPPHPWKWRREEWNNSPLLKRPGSAAGWPAGKALWGPGRVRARAGRRKGVTDTKRGARSGAGTRFFRFGGAAQPELVGQVGEQQEKLVAAACGPFRAGGPGEAEPGLARVLPAAADARRARSLLWSPGSCRAPLGGWVETAEWGEKGVCAEITAVCISVPFSLLLPRSTYGGFAVPGTVGRAPSAASCAGSRSLLLMLSPLVFLKFILEHAVLFLAYPIAIIIITLLRMIREMSTFMSLEGAQKQLWIVVCSMCYKWFSVWILAWLFEGQCCVFHW